MLEEQTRLVCAIQYPLCIKMFVTCSVNQVQRCFCCSPDHTGWKFCIAAPSIYAIRKQYCLSCMPATPTLLAEQGNSYIWPLCCRFKHGTVHVAVSSPLQALQLAYNSPQSAHQLNSVPAQKGRTANNSCVLDNRRSYSSSCLCQHYQPAFNSGPCWLGMGLGVSNVGFLQISTLEFPDAHHEGGMFTPMAVIAELLHLLCLFLPRLHCDPRLQGKAWYGCICITPRLL